jgi:hypothetical protein
MAYVSAKFVKDPITGSTDRLIEAIDDSDPPRVWSVPGRDCQVGDWLRFVEEGGTVEPYTPPAEAKPA